MRLLRCIAAVALLTIVFTGVACAQEKKDFPTDAEIMLMLTQAERSVSQYKVQIEQEEIFLGKNGKDASIKDRQLLDALNLSIKALKSKPQEFNGPIGFYFIESLDDASRNTVLSADQAMMQVVTQVMQGKIEDSASLLNLSQSFINTSTLLYTVSENASFLYQRYVEAEPQLLDYAYKTAKQCADILKNNCAMPKSKR